MSRGEYNIISKYFKLLNGRGNIYTYTGKVYSNTTCNMVIFFLFADCYDDNQDQIERKGKGSTRTP